MCIRDRDQAAIVQLLGERLSEQEIAQAMELYSKYAYLLG